MAFIKPWGTFAVTTGRWTVPDTLAVAISAIPNSSPRSEGLIGVASIRTTTSLSLGSGMGISASSILSLPPDVMVDCN